MRAASVCAEAGCGNAAVRGGRCADHAWTQRPRGSTRAWRRLRAQVIRRDRGVCWLCRRPGADSADHVIPADDGGPDELWNLRAAHVGCNAARGNRGPRW